MQTLLNEGDTSRVIEMAWEDRTPFEAIEQQFGLSESEVIRLMRSEVTKAAFSAGAHGSVVAKPNTGNLGQAALAAIRPAPTTR